VAISGNVAAGPLPLEPVENGVYDPNTGLEWLDLHLTTGQSYSNVLNGWNGYTTTGGFRFATRDEISLLFSDAGGTLGTNRNNLQPAEQLMPMLGGTEFHPQRMQGSMLYDPSTDLTPPNSNSVPTAIFGYGIYSADAVVKGVFAFPEILFASDYAAPNVASALVKVVPEPDCSLLVALGLLGVLFARRTASERFVGCFFYRRPDKRSR
jgi:hypothetical protein